METLSPVALKPGDVLGGKYVLGERIGQGGMGSVFLAQQPALERTVAIKILHPRLARCPAHAQRLRDEAIAASRVRRSHCPAVIDCSELPDGTSYLVMEYIPGRSLARMIADEAISLARAIDLFEQVLDAIGAIHDSGIVHADVKSDNVLVESRDGVDRVTVIDFGLARLSTSTPRADLEDDVEMVSGTPEYMAPEVVCGGAPTPASDLYSAGVILYELLTGATPFGGGGAVAIMLRHAHDLAIPPSLRRPEREISPELDRLVMRALEKRPEARCPDSATFARELRSAAAHASPSLHPSAWRAGSASAAPTWAWSAPSLRRLARGSDCGAEPAAPIELRPRPLDGRVGGRRRPRIDRDPGSPADRTKRGAVAAADDRTSSGSPVRRRSARARRAPAPVARGRRAKVPGVA
jgi:serine/threonine-protein kinase